MAKFSKIIILIFLTLFVSGGFVVFHFSKAESGGINDLTNNELNSDSGSQQNSVIESSIYVCPQATSLEEINPRCPGKIILKLGETINGLTLITTNYEGKDYYLVLGFENGGGAENLPPIADANGPYQGDAGLPITFDATNSSDPNDDSLEYRWDFDSDGNWDTEWLSTSTTDHIWNIDYEGITKLEVSDGQLFAIATTSIKVISSKTFKEEAINQLESAKTGDKRIDLKIERIIKHIQNSLDNNLWIDSSHLVFFKKDCSDSSILKIDPDKIEIEKIFDTNEAEKHFKGKCFGPKIGIRVFYEEYIATKLMLAELKGKPRIPEELKPIFEKVIEKLVKADILLAKVSISDAKNTPIQNPKFQKIVEKQKELADKELQKANEELQKGRPDKAILRLAKSWLYSQLAMKFAILYKIVNY